MEKTKSQFCRLLMLIAVVCFALDVSAQTTVSGHVKDDTGEDVIGASVMEKGTSNGTVTDFDGNYKIDVPKGGKIIVSYIGKLSTISVPGLLVLIAGCIVRAVFIIRLNEAARTYDPVPISAMIAVFVGVISFVIWFFIQPATFAEIEWNTQIVASLFIYAYFIVLFAQTLNIFAQRKATPATATIIYSLEIIFSLIWGMTLPSSIVTPVTPDIFMLIGAAFIVLGNISEIFDFKFKGKAVK